MELNNLMWKSVFFLFFLPHAPCQTYSVFVYALKHVFCIFNISAWKMIKKVETVYDLNTTGQIGWRSPYKYEYQYLYPIC